MVINSWPSEAMGLHGKFKVNGAEIFPFLTRRKQKLLQTNFNTFSPGKMWSLHHFQSYRPADMPAIKIEVEGVKKLLLNINITKVIGPDQIQNQALKIAAKELAPVLQFIFQQSLERPTSLLSLRRVQPPTQRIIVLFH